LVWWFFSLSFLRIEIFFDGKWIFLLFLWIKWRDGPRFPGYWLDIFNLLSQPTLWCRFNNLFPSNSLLALNTSATQLVIFVILVLRAVSSGVRIHTHRWLFFIRFGIIDWKKVSILDLLNLLVYLLLLVFVIQSDNVVDPLGSFLLFFLSLQSAWNRMIEYLMQFNQELVLTSVSLVTLESGFCLLVAGAFMFALLRAQEYLIQLIVVPIVVDVFLW